MTKILIVEDDPMISEIYQKKFGDSGYEILTADSGEKAVKLDRTEKIDAMLLDLIMPKMDGYEVCKRLKTSDVTEFIPVIMLTALSSVEDKVKGIEAGADDFISKPFQKPELLARVRSLVRVKNLLEEFKNYQIQENIEEYIDGLPSDDARKRILALLNILKKRKTVLEYIN